MYIKFQFLCSEALYQSFDIQSEGVHISALEHCRKIKFSIYVHQTLAYTQNVNSVMLE